MNGYQKLRQRIKELEDEKRVLIEEPESYQATLIKAEYQMSKSFQNMVLFGDGSRIGEGIVTKVM